MGQTGRVCEVSILSDFINCDGRYYKTNETKGKWIKFLKSISKLEKSEERKRKMRPLSVLGAVFMMGTMITLSTACAEIIEVKSRITDISETTTPKSVKVYRLDPQTEKTEEIEVEVDDSTLFGRIKSLQDLKVGDEVVIEAD